jgi:hypothetical protein
MDGGPYGQGDDGNSHPRGQDKDRQVTYISSHL